MFCIVDREKNMTPLKSGFHTAAQANNWAKKNLPKDDVKLWKDGFHRSEMFKLCRYMVVMR